MFIIRIWGGLGNQLFQYAFARSLSIQYQMDFKIDISYYQKEKSNQRKYRLNYFAINPKITNQSDLKRILYPTKYNYLKLALNSLKKKIYPNVYQYIKEPKNVYDLQIIGNPLNKYYSGYWQSEKYFQQKKSLIKKDFYFLSNKFSFNEKILAKISNTNAIALHIRRGDYNKSNLKNIYGICNLNYYYQALDLLLKKLINPHIFIFTDDINWTRQNFKSPYPFSFVIHEGINNDIADLYLMSHCQHFIIANSTFSWWGAWLADFSEKIVIAPKIWYKSPFYDDKDLIPEKWIRI